MSNENTISVDTTTNSISSTIEDIESRIEKDKNETIDWVSNLSLKLFEQEKKINEFEEKLNTQYVKKPDKIGCCIYFLNYTIYLPVKLNWLQKFIVKHLFKAVHVINEL